jgi:hypothetical protein
MIITAASVMEISIALAGVIGAIAACIHGSKCTEINCCGCSIKRDIRTDTETDIEMPPIPISKEELERKV